MSNKFTFNASALGLGGVITEDGCTTVIPSLASVALAPTGGEGSSRVENYCVNGISFSRAETRVVGYETSKDVFTTTTDILITNLNIREKLKIALMQATVTSTRQINQPDSEFNLHAMYRGIESDGEEIEAILDVDLCSGPCGRASTFDDYRRSIQNNLPRHAALLGIKPEVLQDALKNNQDPMPGAVVMATQTRKNGKVVPYPGNRLAVNGLGNAFLGELLVKKGRRRLNLLRFDFGAPAHPAVNGGAVPMLATLALTNTSGSLTVGSADGNGEPVWPRQ